MVDSGATIDAISPRAMRKAGIQTRNKEKPFGLSLIDGSSHANGTIKTETEPFAMVIGDHEETIQMNVISMKHDIILGQPWLEKH